MQIVIIIFVSGLQQGVGKKEINFIFSEIKNNKSCYLI